MNKVNPDVVTLNEHGVKNKKKIIIPGFITYSRNRTNQNMGGVSTSISEKDRCSVIKVCEGSNQDEFLITRHSQFKTPINILNIYGEQENKNTNDKILERWLRICEQCAKIAQRNEAIGDGEYVVKIGESC